MKIKHLGLLSFGYSLAGAILPKDDRATYSVSLLKLDIEFLRNRRGEALPRVFNAAFIESARVGELQTLAQAFRAPDTRGNCESLSHVVARFAEQLMESAV